MLIQIQMQTSTLEPHLNFETFAEAMIKAKNNQEPRAELGDEEKKFCDEWSKLLE